MSEIRLVTFNPGHFHAALVQKEMYPGVSSSVHVYAPLGQDLLDHLGRISRFNARGGNPTRWELEVHAGPDALERLIREKSGNVVVFSGRNRTKIDAIQACVEAGLNVLADKPWIIRREDYGKLAATLAAAEQKGLIAYDIMTERYEITSLVQRELVQDAAVFGEMIPGDEENPGVYMESVHHLLKMVAGAPNLRPAWFFDVNEQGEALADVGTHLVDLTQWTLFPGEIINADCDVRLVSASRWPTVLTQAEFAQVTGERVFPEYLAPCVRDGRLDYFCNTRACYAVRGVHVKMDVLWRYQAPEGAGDTHLAVYRGTRSRVEVRQGAAERYRPEVYVAPEQGAKAKVGAALRNRLAAAAGTWPGLEVEDLGSEFRIGIPDSYRVGHEAHFGQVTRQFLEYLAKP